MLQNNNIPHSYIVFDLETSGLGNNAEIIEIGAIKVIDGMIADVFKELIKPTHKVSEQSTAVNGISTCDLKDCRCCSEVLSDFIDFIGTDILVGHNIGSFDIPFLVKNVDSILNKHFKCRYIDTRTMSEEITDVSNHRLETMLEFYGIHNQKAHRAFEDSEATHKLFLALLNDGVEPSIITSKDYHNTQQSKDCIDFEISERVLNDVFGKKIVLTGDFEFGEREDIECILDTLGATVQKSVGKKTDYLIVGNYASPKWVHKNGGKKTEAAKSLGIEILCESSIESLLLSAPTAEQIILFEQDNNTIVKQLRDIVESARAKYGYYKMHTSGMYEMIKSAPESELYDILDLRENKDGSIAFYFDNQLYIKFDIKKSRISTTMGRYQELLKDMDLAVLKHRGAPLNGITVKFWDGCIKFFTETIDYLVKVKKPSNKFSCCSRHELCTNAGHCLHEHQYYAKGCQYRENLENGKVFYQNNT